MIKIFVVSVLCLVMGGAAYSQQINSIGVGLPGATGGYWTNGGSSNNLTFITPLPANTVIATELRSPYYVVSYATSAPYPPGQTSNASDGNSGTLAAPFATIQQCVTAHLANYSGAPMTCYIRGGTYQPTVQNDTSGNFTLCGVANSTGGAAVDVGKNGTSDSGITFTYWPADGVDSPVIDGQAALTVKATTTGTISDNGNGTSNITVASGTNIAVGQLVQGAGVFAGFVKSGSGTSWVMDTRNTISPSETLTFSLPTTSGLGCIFQIRNNNSSATPSNTTIDGLTLENTDYQAAYAFDIGNNIRFLNNIVNNAGIWNNGGRSSSFKSVFGGALQIQCNDVTFGYNMSGAVISHNVIQTTGEDGVRMMGNDNAGNNCSGQVGPQVTNNYVFSSCVLNYDCGGIYVRSWYGAAGSPGLIKYNYVNDVNPNLVNGNLITNSGIYLDGWPGNINISYNVVIDPKVQAMAIGQQVGSVAVSQNIFDLGALPTWPESPTHGFLASLNFGATGGSFSGNIFTMNVSTAPAGFESSGGGAVTVSGNDYFNYGSASVNYTCQTGPPGCTPNLSATAPILTAQTSGGSMADGTYDVFVTYLNSVGETVASALTAATISGGGGAGSIKVTYPAPQVAPNITNWNIYECTSACTAPSSDLCNASPQSPGTNYTITASCAIATHPPASNGALQDSNPIIANPIIKCWGAFVQPGISGPPPIAWNPPAAWGTPGFWGPPGWFGWVGQGTAPSWSTTGCIN